MINAFNLLQPSSIFVAVSVASLMMFTVPVNSTLTPVNDSNTSEANLIDNATNKNPSSLNTSIMNTLFGAGNYIRVDDSIDQLWSSQGGTATIIAKFAGNTETIGTFNGASGPLNASTFNPLFTVTGSEYAVSGTATIPVSSLFRFGLETSPEQGTVYLSSQNLDNADQMDHMVTFYIPSTGDYVLAFEDLLAPQSDEDFNDAVFEVSSVTPGVGVPEPTLYLMLGSSLAGISLLKRKEAYQQTSS